MATYYSSVAAKPRVVVERNRQTVTIEGTPADPPKLSKPQAQIGVPVPYVLGRQRVFAPNLIWNGNIRPITRTTKELISSETELTPYGPTHPAVENTWLTETVKETVKVTTEIIGYYQSMQYGLALGPGVILRKIFVDNVEVWSGTAGPLRTAITLTTPTPLLGTGIIFQGGNLDQPVDTFLDDYIPADQLSGYPGIAYIILTNVRADLVTGNSGRLSFEIERHPDPLGITTKNKIGDDLNLASAYADFLGSSWGGAGGSLSDLDTASFVSASNTLFDEGNGVSLYLQQESDVGAIISMFNEQARSLIFQDPGTGKIRMRLIRRSLASPSSTTLLSDRNVSRINSIDKQSWVWTTNKVRLGYTSRLADYTQDSLLGYNFNAQIPSIKANRTLPLDFPMVMTAVLGQSLLDRELKIRSTPLGKYILETSRQTGDILPGDSVTLLLPKNGIAGQLAWVDKIQRFGIEDNKVIVSSNQFESNSPGVNFGTPETKFPDPVNPAIKKPTTISILSAPYWFARKKGLNSLMAVTSPSEVPILIPEPVDNFQTSFSAWISNRPGTTGIVQTIDHGAYCTVALLNGTLPRSSGITTGLVASVSIDGVVNASNLRTIGESGARDGELLAFIGAEIISFESATDNGDGTWTLGNVRRGLLDTVAVDHADNTKMYIVGNDYTYMPNSLFPYPLGYTPAWRITSNIVGADGDIDTDYTASSAWNPAVNRTKLPYRPHNTKIENQARDAPPVPVVRSGSIVATWLNRSKETMSVQFQTDATEFLAIDSAGKYPKMRIWIRDSGATLRDCGATLDDSEYTTYTGTVPVGTALGEGVAFVRTETSYGNSAYDDTIPVVVVTTLPYVAETPADTYYVTEDGTGQYTQE